MNIDKDLINFPTASPIQRSVANLLDKILLIIVPLLAGLILSPLYLLTFTGVPVNLIFAIIIIGIVAAFAFMLLWGNWMRVGDTGQTYGMNIAKVAIASDPSTIENPLLYKWFFWTRIGKSSSDNRWAGDEGEERIDTQLWRGLVPIAVIPILGLAFLIFEILGRIPFIFFSLVIGEFNLMASNHIVTKVIIGILLFYFITVTFGFLLALNKQRRTLVEYFLGIKLVSLITQNKN